MKKRLVELLQQRNTPEIVDWAVRRKRVLNMLVSSMYDPDPLIVWRAIEAMGAATERIAQKDAKCVRDHLRRLHWLLSEESGGICWRSPEAMAEIVRRKANLFQDYVPIIVSLIREMADEDLDHFRAGVLWAIGRLGPIAEKEFNEVLPRIKNCLFHPDPQVRGMAVWCLARCGRSDLVQERSDLRDDQGLVLFYADGDLEQLPVSELADRLGSAEK